MKILHCSDWHLGAYVGPQQDNPYYRTANTRKCLDVVVEATKDQQPDIILITGDIFHQSRTWSDRGMIEAQIAIDYIETLGSYAPVAILYGTPNHDNLEAFKMLEQAFGKDCEEVQFFYTPELRTINTKSGLIQVGSLPGFDKGFFRATHPGLSAEDENKLFSELLAQILEGFNANLNPYEPSVLMAHHTIIGCDMGNGYNVFQANEVTLSAEALNRCGFDLVAMGHIHKPQRVSACQKPVFYAGSIDAYTFNDEGHKKGFYIHTVDDLPYGPRYAESDFIFTPAKEFATCRWDQEAISDYSNIGFKIFTNLEFMKDKVTRIQYACDSDTDKALDKKKLERDLYAAGAYYVTEIRPEKIDASVNQERLNEKMTVYDCMYQYCREKNIDPDTTEKLLDAAIPLIMQAEASMPAAGQTGFFLPLEVEVKNYRSYKEEKLDFTDIFFAMVNGENGSGKSSLMMDAPCDCLYEQPREGELTGWIRTGEKSGNISFTFILGKDIWRVTRTRTRSGKATLSLAKLEGLGKGMSYNKDFDLNWEDHSCQKLVDTQQKIVDLLGMDCSTFQSCVLIMQDKYGIFMEAKSEDRMAILANLLGLGIYEVLEGLAKEKLTDANRELRNLKEQIGELATGLEHKTEIQLAKEDADKNLVDYGAILDLKKAEEQELINKISEMERTDTEMSKHTKEAARMIESKTGKKQRFEKLQGDINKTKDFLDAEAFYTTQYNKFIELNSKLSEISGKQMILLDKKKSFTVLMTKVSDLSESIKSIKGTIEHTVDRSSDKQYMETFLSANQNIEARLQGQKDVEGEYNELQDKINALTTEIRQIELKRIWNRDKGKERLEAVKQKAAMLESSNCIDPEKAQCRFLADAIAAQASIPTIEAENEDLDKKATDILETLVESKERLESEQKNLIYNPEATAQLNETLRKYNDYKTDLAKIESSDSMLAVNKERLRALEDEYAALSGSIDTLQGEIEELKKECFEYENISTEIGRLKPDEEKYHKIPAGKEYLKSMEPQLQELTKEIEDLDSLINQKMKAAQEMAGQIVDILPLRDKLTDLKEDMKNLENRITMVNRAIGGYIEKLETMKASEELIKDKNEKLNEIASQASIFQVLAAAFSQDGIPHQIIRDIIPEIEASANETLSQMTGGWMRVDFKTERTLKSNKNKEVATLDIMTSDAYFGEMPYLSRSGGQKTRINLAVGFALAMVKASRVGLQLGMMFVDEPSWLDDKGTEEYCTALQAIHNKYPEMRIVAISHDASMKMQFPQQLWVELTEEGSKIRRV
ncbi:MAG TPA: metallophosphoesterase [Negativicutes bacterium]|nr:metallophosphoesterase [Negativicutes bacterium]